MIEFPEFMPAMRSLGGGRWKTLEPWTISINGMTTTIPNDFVTDLYSVPWPFTLFIPRDQRSNAPSLIHDWLYATCGLRRTAEYPPRISRRECDQILYQVAKVCGLSWIQRRLILRGLTLGSWRPWARMLRENRSLANPRMD